MELTTEFVELDLGDLRKQAAFMKADGWRFIQTHAVNTDEGVDLYYSFMKGGLARNYKIKSVQKDMPVPSITDLFLAAFVFENEARELFGVDMRDIAIDFQGGLYAPAISEPMTILTPEMKAARDKARKTAAAKASKASGAEKDKAPEGEKPAPRIFVMTDERRARLEKRLATMSPDKVAKVRAALAAREAEAAAAKNASSDAKPAEAVKTTMKESPAKAAKPAEAAKKSEVDSVLENKIAAMDPEKAEKVRTALGMSGGGKGEASAAAETGNAEVQPQAANSTDAELEEKLAAMDSDKAERVRAALKARESGAASEGGR